MLRQVTSAISTINKIAGSDKETISNLSNSILKDFSLTNKILRLVNSVYYRQAGGGSMLFGNWQFLNMQRALYEGQRGHTDQRVWSINRNFWPGSQRYAYAMWSGDIDGGFASMANQRERMLAAIHHAEPDRIPVAPWGLGRVGWDSPLGAELVARTDPWIETGMGCNPVQGAVWPVEVERRGNQVRRVLHASGRDLVAVTTTTAQTTASSRSI